jgi:hypothetical protein
MGLAPMEIDSFEKGINKGKSKGKQKGKDNHRVKERLEAKRAKESPTRAPHVLQLPMACAFTVGSFGVSNVSARNFIDAVMQSR